MIFSAPFPCHFHDKPATLEVIRNDGYCWGRLTAHTGEVYDIFTRKDHYDRTDEEAAAAFIRASRSPKCVRPSRGTR